MVTYQPSRKLSNLDEPDIRDTAGEVRTNSCGPHHMVDELEPIHNSSVPVQDVALKTYWERWTIVMGGERGSGRSVLAARHDDEQFN